MIEKNKAVASSAEEVQAMNWALSLPDDDFWKIVVLLKREEGSVLDMIEEFSMVNEENDEWVFCLEKLREFILERDVSN